MTRPNMSRRDFTKLMSGMGMATAAMRLLNPAHLLAQTIAGPSDYKALVCIDLDGGCDSNNLVVPLQSDQFAGYLSARPNLAVDKRSLIQFKTSKGDTYGFNQYIPTLAGMYAKGQCAVVANTGPICEPTTTQMMRANAAVLPTNLEDHMRQRLEWGTCFNDTSAVASTHTGWGGRMADALTAYSLGQFPIVTAMAAGEELSFAYGATSSPALLQPNMESFPSQISKSLQLFSKMSSGSTMIAAAVDGVRNAYLQDAALRAALAIAPVFKTQFPQTALAAQLQQVAQLIACRSALGLKRQIFVVQHNGFDMHGSQNMNEPIILGQLDAAISSFQSALLEIGISDNILSFTTTDFNRTLEENSATGTDHAWGGHQFVFGTGLKSSDMYGTFPELAINSPDDYQGNGSWVPTTSVDQYGATLASWMGVPDSSLTSLFPNLSKFPTAKLGFV